MIRNSKYNQPGQDRLSYEHNINLIHKIAKSGLGRLSAVGISVEYSDIVGELCVAFTKARAGYKPDAGAAFSTYLTRACFNTLNRFCDRLITERAELGLYSINEVPANMEDLDLYDVVASDELTPEQVLERDQETRLMIENLSPVAQFLVGVLMSPPPELMEEFQAHQAHAKYAREIDAPPGRMSSGLTLTFIGRFYKIEGKLIKEVKRELTAKFGVNFAGAL